MLLGESAFRKTGSTIIELGSIIFWYGMAHTSVPSPKSLEFRCVQNGSSASRTGAKGAYLDRYVTDEQRSSRPIFNATLRAAVSWLFFRVARSTRMTPIWALRSRLEKQPTDLRRNSRDLGDGTLAQAHALSERDPAQRFPARIRQVPHDPESSYLVNGRRSAKPQ